MKVIIAGSRSITAFDFVRACIEQSKFQIDEIVSGKAEGVDKLGELYGSYRGIPICSFPADWKLYGKAAGVIRNYHMAEYADAAIVIWDGKSKGAKHMADQMIKLKKPCSLFVIYEEYNGNK